MDGVRESFVQQSHISREEHEMFMKKYSDMFFVCIEGQKKLGFIGIINNDIRIATDPDCQGKGVGAYMLREAMKKNPEAFAKVKVGNKASLRLFESCGFKKKYYIFEQK